MCVIGAKTKFTRCYPARACAARGKVISGVHKKIYSFFGTNLLSLKILTFRALFQHR